MRIALVVLALLAIVLPTALISETAAAHGNVYSVQQVLRVFRAEGIPLRRQADNEANSESFSSPGRAHVDVSVFVPSGASQTSFLVVTSGSTFPQIRNRGNVEVDWTPKGNAKAEAAKVHAALGRLRYSATDATLRPPATITLLPGQSRLIQVTPIGTEVDCVHGSSNDGEVIRPASHTSSSSAYSGNDVVASLSWRRVASSVFAVSCSGLAPLPPLKVIEQGVARNSPRLCRPGPRVVRVAGLVARVPQGWYVAESHPQQALWIANRRQCDTGRPPGPAGLSLTLKLEMRTPEAWPGGSSFLIGTGRSTLRDVRHGFAFESDPYHHRFYSLSAFFGRRVREGLAIELANSVLRGVRPRPR